MVLLVFLMLWFPLLITNAVTTYTGTPNDPVSVDIQVHIDTYAVSLYIFISKIIIFFIVKCMYICFS